MAKVLLVEDEIMLGESIADWLKADGHAVDFLQNGRDAEQQLRHTPYDLIILDWGLPEVTGIEICRELRLKGTTTPILMLTGRREIAEKETGLDAGADDYLTKPFHPREFSARVRALLRRVPAVTFDRLEVGNLVLEHDSRKVTRDGELIHLQPLEFALLEFFMRHPGEVFSVEALLARVWASDAEPLPDNVRTSISKLRSKIDSTGEQSRLKSVYGVGYKFEPSK